MATRKDDTILFDCPPVIAAWAAAGGKKEGEGPLAAGFDLLVQDASFAGEGCANWEQAESLLQQKAAAACLRKGGISRKEVDLVLAVGGGIVTDVAGFAASTYMRGLRFGFVSTTLLGQVDASVGGKNGVNVDGYKNMAGTFTQPQFVVCDPSLLRSLPDREFRAGLAEVVKAAIIADADLFARIEQTSFEALRTDTDLLSDAISAAIRVKADIVEHDEKESGERRKLNLGHTLAHAIEKSSNRMNHGEAVAVGTALIAGAAVKLGVLKEEDRLRIEKLLVRLGFDLTPPVEIKRLLKEVGKDKKNEDGMLRIVLPVGIGDCEVRKMAPGEFAALFV